MANVSTGSWMVLDTAEAVVVTGTHIRILAIRYVGTTNVDDCVVSDAAGKIIWASKLGAVATVGCQDQTYFGTDGIVVNGLTVTTLDNGKVYVYLGKL